MFHAPLIIGTYLLFSFPSRLLICFWTFFFFCISLLRESMQLCRPHLCKTLKIRVVTFIVNIQHTWLNINSFLNFNPIFKQPKIVNNPIICQSNQGKICDLESTAVIAFGCPGGSQHAGSPPVSAEGNAVAGSTVCNPGLLFQTYLVLQMFSLVYTETFLCCRPPIWSRPWMSLSWSQSSARTIPKWRSQPILCRYTRLLEVRGPVLQHLLVFPVNKKKACLNSDAVQSPPLFRFIE